MGVKLKTLKKASFDFAKLEKEIDAFELLLNSKKTLSENDDIIPFFKKCPNISLFLSNYFPYVETPTHLAYEFPILGDFRADLAVGDMQSGAFCFIEFEDASEDSIFTQNGKKATSEWGKRFEHGHSQIVDWFYKLDNYQGESDILKIFGKREIRYMGILLIGRNSYLSDHEKLRLNWRLDNVLINSKKIVCLTYDDLLFGLKRRLKTNKFYNE